VDGNRHQQGRLEQRDEPPRSGKGIVELLDQMVELMGDEPSTLADFIEIYETGMEQFELALTPPTTDEIIVGQVDRTRSPELRVVFILGMNEGVFRKPNPKIQCYQTSSAANSPLEIWKLTPTPSGDCSTKTSSPTLHSPAHPSA